jgi:hypothetical protein
MRGEERREEIRVCLKTKTNKPTIGSLFIQITIASLRLFDRLLYLNLNDFFSLSLQILVFLGGGGK